jgi:hypothetical protein
MNEFINREDALDAVLFALVGTGHQSRAIYAIRELSTADVVEVRHGEWMDGFSRQICSVCFYRGCKAFKYCPNCGTKMERTEVSRKKKETDLTDRCGSCQWAKKIKGSSKGVFGCYIECQNPNKVWKRDIAKRKQRTNPKCKHYIERVAKETLEGGQQ